MEQTEPSAMTLAGTVRASFIEMVFPEPAPKKKPTQKQLELRKLIEDITIASRNGRSYYKGLHRALDEEYSAREVDKAIRALRRRRVLNEHKEGPDDIAYSINNKFKAWVEGLHYL